MNHHWLNCEILGSLAWTLACSPLYSIWRKMYIINLHHVADLFLYCFITALKRRGRLPHCRESAPQRYYQKGCSRREQLFALCLAHRWAMPLSTEYTIDIILRVASRLSTVLHRIQCTQACKHLERVTLVSIQNYALHSTSLFFYFAASPPDSSPSCYFCLYYCGRRCPFHDLCRRSGIRCFRSFPNHSRPSASSTSGIAS